MYIEDLILFYLPSLDEEVYRRIEFGLEKRSLGGKADDLFSLILGGGKVLLQSASVPVTPQQTSSFATKDSITPGTVVRLR